MPKRKVLFHWSYDEHGSAVYDAVQKALTNAGISFAIDTKDDDAIFYELTEANVPTSPVKECRRPDGKWFTEGEPVVWLPFSAYELGNLSAMFQAIFPSRYGLAHIEHNPLAVFNSGDWTGVVGDRFVFTARIYASNVRGNRTPQEYVTDTKYYGK